MSSKFAIFFDDVLGSQREFSLRDRVVNAGTFSSTIIGLLITLADTLQGIGLVSSAFTLGLAAAFGLLYFLGRRRPRGKLIILPFFLIGLVSVFYDWRFFYGLRGTSLLISLTISVMIPIVLSGMRRLIAVTILSLFLAALFVFELQNPGFIDNYPSRQSHLTDLIVTSLLLGTGTLLLVSLVIKSYNDQRHQNKKLNKALLQSNERLRESIGTKDRFFSIISHDLRGPVGSLSHLGEMLSNNIEERPLEEQKELLTSIKDSSGMAFSLLDNLLNWALTETGELNPKPEELDIKELIDENISLMASSAASKEITLENNCASQTIIFADKEMVKLVIRNLLSNALKFTRKNGFVSLGIQAEETHLVSFYIKDNGVGIPKEKIESLFNSESESTYGTSAEKGTGLGLQLCWSFVAKNLGTLQVESEEGKGSKFTVSLPKSIPTEEKEIHAESTSV